MEEKIGSITETKAFEQLGILVLDGSGSMATTGETGLTKANEVNNAVRGLISRLKVSRLKENFYLSVVTYDDKVNKERLVPTTISQIDETTDFDPTNGHGEGTAIGDALEAAGTVADEFLSEQKSFPRSVVIVLMTDGQNNSGKDPVEVSRNIKSSGKRINVCAAGYGKSEEIDSLTLQKLVTDGSGYVRAYDPEALRKFFEASVSRIKG